MKVTPLLFIVFFFNFKLICQLPCNIADRCEDISTSTTLGPFITDPNCGDFQPKTITGCLNNATPETIIANCSANMLPTVWFKIDIDDSAVQIGTACYPKGNWKPIWAIYYGTCSNLKLVSGGPLSNQVFCSNGDNNSFIHTVGAIEEINSYYIAISGEGVIDDPTFTLNVWTSSNCISCIGQEGCNPEAIWSIKKRSSNKDLKDPFFIQGEKVTVCVDFRYDASGTASDMLHGIIPDFGDGWDLDIFHPELITINIGNPLWISQDGDICSPKTTQQLPYLCTYTDPITGKFKICHTGCQICPCSSPMLSGSPLPSGWFWNNPGGPGCTNGCSPSSHFGIGSSVVELNFCIDLQVKVFNSDVECYVNRNLDFNFQTISHGVSGCYNDPTAECTLDYAQIGPNWNIDCSAIDTCKFIVYDTIYTTIYDTSIVTVISNISVTDTLFITLNIPNASNEIEQNVILIYPNPASSHIYIDMGDHTLLNNYEVQILNALGQPVYFTPIDKKLYYIDLNNWGGKGTYFVKIKNNLGATVETKKIILK